MNKKEIIKLRNKIAIKETIKIILFSILVILLFSNLIDGIYNNILAETLSGINRQIYIWCVINKPILLIISYIIICAIISYIVIKLSNNNIIAIILAIDTIMKDPEQDIKLPNDLLIIENRLNKIRVDLITSKNKAEESTQKKNDLIMYMAHDLKTPLTSVIGYLTLLTEEKQISQELQEKYIKIALNKSLRVEELTNQFFEITRYNLSEISINKNKIDLSFLLEQLLDEFYPMLQEKNLKYVIDKPNHVYYMGDGDKLARAFGNLLKNAISYSYDNTNIEVQLTESDNKIQLLFRNKGDKIPEYKLDKIFDKFYRVDESRYSNSGGAGLGLAITKEIIELHKGKIYVKNDNEFIEFYIEL